jgi:hypothetical protein
MAPFNCNDWIAADEDRFTQSCSKSASDTNVSVLFVCCPFLVAPRLHCLDPEECKFLEERGSLHVPTGYVLDTFVRHYFQHVHPCLPLIDEAEFWRIYHGEESSCGVSLLLFKAMLFAAACVGPSFNNSHPFAEYKPSLSPWM